MRLSSLLVVHRVNNNQAETCFYSVSWSVAVFLLDIIIHLRLIYSSRRLSDDLLSALGYLLLLLTSCCYLNDTCDFSFLHTDYMSNQ